jgi:hypothetical protein
MFHTDAKEPRFAKDKATRGPLSSLPQQKNIIKKHTARLP